jgi:hypothetical protein
MTLTIIEIFAVPGALAGALLYPLGLDAFVWPMSALASTVCGPRADRS